MSQIETKGITPTWTLPYNISVCVRTWVKLRIKVKVSVRCNFYKGKIIHGGVVLSQDNCLKDSCPRGKLLQIHIRFNQFTSILEIGAAINLTHKANITLLCFLHFALGLIANATEMHMQRK